MSKFIVDLSTTAIGGKVRAFLYELLKGFSGESPARAAASQVCPDAFPGYAFSYVTENLFGEYIPDPAERKAFAAKVQESFDGTGNATFHMFFPSICLL
jgi:hypothetical protein